MRIGTALLILLLAGCGGASTDAAVGRGGDLEATARALNRAMGATTAWIASGVVATNVTAENICSGMAIHVGSETGGCAQVTVNGAEADADFGQGCALASADFRYAGGMHMAVARTPDEVDLTLTLDGTVDGQALTGTLTASTTDSVDFTYEADLTLGAVHVVAPYLRAGIGGYGATLEAHGTLTGANTLSFMMLGLHQQFGGCFPDGGTAELIADGLDETWTFDTATPQTGVAQVGNPSKAVTLPARTGCGK